MICQMEGTDINPFINEIEKVIQEFKGSER